MAKIPRETHKLFGSAGVTSDFAQFGSQVAGTPLKTKDIASIQNLPAWSNNGFADAIYGSNKALLLEDLNSWAYEHSYQMAYVLQMGIAEWDSGTTYYKGSIVQRVDGSGNATGELYASAADNNTGNAPPTQTNNANWTYLNPPPLPAGASIEFMGRIVPAGWLWEDGSAYSRTTYAALLAAISVTMAGNLVSGSPVVTGIPSTSNIKPNDWISGTGIPTGARVLTVDSGSQVTMTINATSTQSPSTLLFAPWGVGDGVTTFNVPDTRRRVGVGAGGVGTSVLGADVGATGGEEAHQLTIAEMPSHTHTVNTLHTRSHGGGTDNIYSESNPSEQSGATGGGSAHNNMQPSYVAVKIIKY